MSFRSSLVTETRHVLLGLIKSIRSRSASDLIDILERDLDDRGLEDIVQPIVSVYQSDAERASDRDFEDLVTHWGRVAGESCAIQSLDERRLVRELTRDEEDNLRKSLDEYGGVCREAKRTSRHERRDDERRDRPRRPRRDEDKTRHTNSFEREGDERRPRRDDDRPKRKEKEVEEMPIIERSLNDGDTVTMDNFNILSLSNKDLPFYYAGIEKLVYKADIDKVAAIILDGDQMLNYKEHQTDVYLSPNRDINNIGIVVEDLDKKLKEASETRVKAFVEDQAEKKEDEAKEESVKRLRLTKSSIVEGVYRLDSRLLGEENELRAIISEVIENPNFSEDVIGITIQHTIDDLENVDRNSEDYIAFINLVNQLSIETKLIDIKGVLVLAQRLFTPANYDIIYRIYNDAVCNALSTSLKLGIKTSSILRDWNDIEHLINQTYEAQPQIIPVIEMNLCSALPTIIEEEGFGITVYRNYIFLPVTKTDFTISSPIRYATINKSNRPEMYGAINKLLTTNLPKESHKPLTTLVTLDNYSLSLFKNRSLVTDSGYYVFKPID